MPGLVAPDAPASPVHALTARGQGRADMSTRTTAFYGGNPFLYEPDRQGRRHWRLDRQKPPGDAYDDHPLVPAHWSVSPAMTQVDDAYRYDTRCDRLSQWTPKMHTVNELADEVLRAHGVPDVGRRGLYICGHMADVVYSPDANGNDRNSDRERIMVFVIELSRADRHKWRDMHEELVEVLVRAGVRDYHGVPIRYFELRTSISLTAEPEPLDGLEQDPAEESVESPTSPMSSAAMPAWATSAPPVRPAPRSLQTFAQAHEYVMGRSREYMQHRSQEQERNVGSGNAFFSRDPRLQDPRLRRNQ